MQIDKYEIRPMLLKDYQKNRPLIEKVSGLEGLPDEEQCEALVTLLSQVANVSTEEINNNFTLEMAKNAVSGYLGLNGVTYKIADNMNGVVYLDKIETGSILMDRYGKEHKAHSVMFKNMDRVRELLPKIDPIVTVNNILDIDNGEYVDDAYESLIELLQMTLDETKEEIERYLDAEFARKAIRICLDLPMIA